MSAGAIAVTAIVVCGSEGLALIAAATWLIHHKRILFAATPKPQAQQQGAAQQPVPVIGGRQAS